MFILHEALIAIARILQIILSIYLWIIIIAVMISWLTPEPDNPVARFFDKLTAPVLKPVRKLLFFWPGPLDFSPVLIILGLKGLDKLLDKAIGAVHAWLY